VILDAEISPSGDQVAMLTSAKRRLGGKQTPEGSAFGFLYVFDWRTGKPVFSPMATSSEPRSLSFDDEGRQLAVVCSSGDVLIVNTATGATVKAFRVGQDYKSMFHILNNGAVRFGPRSQTILVWGGDPEARDAVHVLDAQSGKLRYPPLSHDNKVFDVRFSSDGRYLATACLDASVCVWDFSTGRPAANPLQHPDWVFNARFNSDASLIVTPCRDGAARLWNWRTGALACRPFEHPEEVMDADFTPDGRWILTTSRDNTFRAWEWHTGNPVTPPVTRDGAGWRLAVTPDGKYVAVAGGGSSLDIFALHKLRTLEQQAQNLDAIVTWCEVLSGRRIHQGGSAILTAEEWLERWRSSCKGNPEYARFCRTLTQTDGVPP
jgi:WD40 repeat protein